MSGIQYMLAPAGPIAGWVAALWWLLFWLCVIVYVATLVPLLYWVWRSRRMESSLPANERGKIRVVAVAVGLTTLILMTLVGVSAAVGDRTSDIHARGGIPIYVTAQQWWWEVVYPNPDASLTVTTANEIHIPAGRKVKIELRSTDVIHSFWVPNLAGKRDMIPGRVNLTWLQADHPGVYRGQCAEFCGHQHAHMAFAVVAHTPEEFERWLTHQRKPAAEPDRPERIRGKQVFQTQACILCHAIRGAQAFGAVGPDLTHFGSRQSIGAATLRNSPERLREWILDSQRFKPGNRMPPVNIPPDDLRPLVSYLENLQ